MTLAAARPLWSHVAFFVFAAAAVASGYRVFRTDSMVRASFLLLVSFVNVGAIFLLMAADYLGFALVFMMTVEMTVMALFMVAFMMNPAGLNPMQMVHQPKAAAAAGWLMFAGGVAVAVFGHFPHRLMPAGRDQVASLGSELLGDSMLVFETVGVTLLATMVGSVVLSSRRSRFGDGAGDEGSLPPSLDPTTAVYPAGVIVDDGHDDGHHDGHDGGHGHGHMMGGP